MQGSVHKTAGSCEKVKHELLCGNTEVYVELQLFYLQAFGCFGLPAISERRQINCSLCLQANLVPPSSGLVITGI